MTRAAITKVTIQGPYPVLPVSALALDLTFTAADVGNSNSFVPSGDDLLLVWNTHATLGYTFTLSSVADAQGRTGDITAYAIAAGVISAFRIKKTGWMQTDGSIYLAGSNAAVKFCIIPL